MNFNIFRTDCREIPVSSAIRLCETPPRNTRRRILIHWAMSLNIYDLLIRCDMGPHCKPWITSFSSGLLPTDLPLASGRSQLPVALSVDLLLVAGEHVLRRDVADGTVQADVVVMLATYACTKRMCCKFQGCWLVT